jgi:hypothetical protein
LKSSEPPKPFCAIFILAIISFFLILVDSVFALVFIGLIIAGFLYLFAMVCMHKEGTYTTSWRDEEKIRKTTLLEKIDELSVIFPELCPECNSAINLDQIHLVDDVTIMCPNCLTIIKGTLNE